MEREEGVGWAKRAAAVEAAGGECEPHTLLGVPGAPSLTDRLLLALRTCATHPAGPMAAVAALADADVDVALDAVQRARERYEAMDMPEDRRRIGVAFLDVIERGCNP